jgi:hypothetical protein
VTGCRDCYKVCHIRVLAGCLPEADSKAPTACRWAIPGAAWIETDSLACSKYFRSHSRFQALFSLPRAASRDGADCLPALWALCQVEKRPEKSAAEAAHFGSPRRYVAVQICGRVLLFRRSCPMASVRKASTLYSAQLLMI